MITPTTTTTAEKSIIIASGLFWGFALPIAFSWMARFVCYAAGLSLPGYSEGAASIGLAIGGLLGLGVLLATVIHAFEE
jgi:hypothetical protein